MMIMVAGEGHRYRIRWGDKNSRWRGDLHSLVSHNVELKLEREWCCRGYLQN